MPLSAGTRLGPYEIQSALGAGGMGEVYRARDTRLDRVVAIKILPAALAADPQFRERFDREARAISQLEHPNICALYDTGQQDGTSFLVMQFLEGDTLAERIARGPMPMDQALTIAVQIADALVVAHRAGIVHRDLKPGNVMLTKTGAKLLDFGLAKSGASVIAGSGASMLPTTPAALTAHGTILGTFQYMAPEQLEGEEADARSDIFAFGALLHEMVTGKRAFEGKSHASLVAAILERQPPAISTLQPMSPAALDRIATKCLAKDPEDRWQSAKDLRDALKWLTADGAQVAAPSSSITAAPAVANRRGWIAWTIAAVLFVALAGTLWLGRQGYLQPMAPTPVFRGVVPWPPGILPSDLALSESFTMSPDGRYLAFVAVAAGRTRTLWVRPLAESVAHELPGTENAGPPFWSPDSRFIAFSAQGKLKKIDINGGRPTVVADSAINTKGSWGANDVILYTPKNGPLFRVSAGGGQPVAATVLDKTSGEVTHTGPWLLPDGKRFLYFGDHLSGAGTLHVGSIDGGAPITSIRGIESPAIYSNGFLLFLRDRTLTAQAFDLGRLEVSGESVAIADDIDIQSRPLRGAFTVSSAGTLAYRMDTATVRTQLTWFDRAGKPLSTVGDASDQMNVEMSPDGTRALVSLLEAGQNSRDLWMYDLARGLRTRFTFDPADEMGGVWSRDGNQVVFNSRRGARLDLYMKSSSGAGAETEWLSDGQNNLYPGGFSSDGRTFVFFNGNATSRTGNDLWLVPATGSPRTPTPLVRTQYNETYPQFSADGRWIAYVSNESGRGEVYVTAAGGGGKWQVSTDGGTTPRWRRDGKELYFINPGRKVIAVSVDGRSNAFVVGATQALFDSNIRQVGFGGAGAINYDVSPDGQRFLILTTPDNSAVAPITVVSNWTGLVKK